MGACKAGERVPGVASGDLSIRQRPPRPPVPRHHTCLQRRWSVCGFICILIPQMSCVARLLVGTQIQLTYALSCVVATELHLASYESEGPENNMEKDSRRSLR